MYREVHFIHKGHLLPAQSFSFAEIHLRSTFTCTIALTLASEPVRNWHSNTSRTGVNLSATKSYNHTKLHVDIGSFCSIKQ